MKSPRQMAIMNLNWNWLISAVITVFMIEWSCSNWNTQLFFFFIQENRSLLLQIVLLSIQFFSSLFFRLISVNSHRSPQRIFSNKSSVNIYASFCTRMLIASKLALAHKYTHEQPLTHSLNHQEHHTIHNIWTKQSKQTNCCKNHRISQKVAFSLLSYFVIFLVGRERWFFISLWFFFLLPFQSNSLYVDTSGHHLFSCVYPQLKCVALKSLIVLWV